MKVGSIKYLIKEAFKGAWANRLMSLASIGVLVACMVVIGLALLISKNVSLAVTELEKENVIMVYFEDENWALYSEKVELPEEIIETLTTDYKNELSEDELKAFENELNKYCFAYNDQASLTLCDEIKKIDNVYAVEFIESEAGLAAIKADMLQGQAEYFTFLDEYGGNPISDSAKVTMSDMSKFNETVDKIQKLDGVDVIRAYDGVAEKIDAVKTGIYVAGIWIIAILIIISLVIVSNTIRVTMYNRKLEISIMKAVGATDAFVRIPFVIEGMVIGLISALISEAVIYFCYRVATEKIQDMLGYVVPFSDMALYLLAVFAVIGVVAGAIGSAIMIGKYLKREGSEFTAI